MKRPAKQDLDRGQPLVTSVESPHAGPAESAGETHRPTAVCDGPRDAAPAVCLEILRGRTQFPIRPLHSAEFLIGSSPDCDLRIGGQVPEFHSLIRCDEDGLSIVAVAQHPPVLVRGEPVQHACLSDGDCVSIGGIEFCVRHRGTQPLNAPQSSDSGAKTEFSHLSAAALVDRLEADLELIADSQSGQREAWDLLDHHLRGCREHGEPIPMEFLEQLVQLSVSLEARERELTAREIECSRAASFLVEAQQTLAQQLQQVQAAETPRVPERDLSAA